MTRNLWVLWLMILLSWATTIATTSSNVIYPYCDEKCGDVNVPYPFGIDDSRCAMDKNFLLTCNRHTTPATLMFAENMTALSISVDEGIIVTSINAPTKCYNGSGLKGDEPYNISIKDGPFRFSDSRNKFTAFGCDTLALMGSNVEADEYISGCLSYCIESTNITAQDSCSGIGCCQTPIPKSLKNLTIFLSSIDNHKNVSNFNPCDYVVLDERNHNISDWLHRGPDKIAKSNLTIEWVVKEEACDASTNTSKNICGRNTNCSYSENGRGYRCSCKKGFRGNPYLQDGCQDVDECKEPTIYPCEGKCKNTIGNYTCSCPLGMRGDGKISCHGLSIAKIFSDFFSVYKLHAIIGVIILVVTIGVLTFIAFKQRRKERNFSKNGGQILKNQRVRIFSEAELLKATKSYDKINFLGGGGFGYVYKGILPDNTQVAVKKPKEMDKTGINQEFHHEVGIVSQVNHKNLVKLLGLCLESKVPLLVYEFISNGTLFNHIHNKKSEILRTWNDRLRIATETALALDYFHSLADPPIIHGDVKSANILLDDNGVAKVSDFGTSVMILPGQTLMESKVQGTFGYLDPEYLMTGILTAKSDVYSFGVVLVELLTGVKPGFVKVSAGEKISIIEYFISSVENNTLSQNLGFEIVDEGETEEIEAVAELTKRCLSSSGVRRPTMKDVVEELVGLKKVRENVWAQQNSEETEHLLSGSSSSDHQGASTMIAQPSTHTVISFEIDAY